MIDPDFARAMARYNHWQNESLYGAASALDDADRKLDRGAFFRSIHGTLAHILWGDRIWMHRFTGFEKPEGGIEKPEGGIEKPEGGIPESEGLGMSWLDLCRGRTDFDATILDWAETLEPSDLLGELTWWSGALEREVTASRGLLVSHMFNHQTHHRGQVHAMLTAAGAKPDDTDLMVLATWEDPPVLSGGGGRR